MGRPHSPPRDRRRAYQRNRLAFYSLLFPRPRPWGIVPRPRHRVGPRKVFTSFAPTPLLGWVGDRTPSFSGLGKRPCSPFRADFQGEINGADLRAGHDAPSGPSGSRTLEGRRDARHPPGWLRSEVLQSWRGGAVLAASTAWRPPLFHPGFHSARARSRSLGILRGRLLPRGGPRLRLNLLTPFCTGALPRSLRRWPGREVLPAGESYSGPELQLPLCSLAPAPSQVFLCTCGPRTSA